MISRDYHALIRDQERDGDTFARRAARELLAPDFGTDPIAVKMAKDNARAMRETEQRIDDLFIEWKAQAAALEADAAREQNPENRS